MVGPLLLGLVLGAVGGFVVANLGSSDRSLERAPASSRIGAAATSSPAAGAAPAIASPDGSVVREAADPDADDAAPESLLARAAELARAAPLAAKVGGAKSIRGRIVDVDGRPLAGALVRAGRQPDAHRAPSSSRLGEAAPSESLEHTIRQAVDRFYARQSDLRETTSDGDGRYELAGLREGDWWMAAWHEGFDLNQRGAGSRDGDVQVHPDATVDFVATPVLAVPIAVVLPDGRPAPRAAIAVKVPGSRESPRTEPWTAQRPKLGLLPGTWELTATLGDPVEGPAYPEYFTSAPRTIEVAASGEPPLVTIPLKASSGIRGEVRFADAIADRRNICVKYLPLAPGAAPDLHALAKAEPPGGRVQFERSFFFKNVAPGRYVVGASRWGSAHLLAHAVVDVGDGVVEQDLDVAPLDPALALVVTVKDAKGAAVAEVEFTRDVRRENGSSSGGIEAERQADGTFLIGLEDLADLEGTGGDAVNAADAGAWPEGTRVVLTALSERFGRKLVDVTPAQRRIEIVFGSPARLIVTAPGARESGVEGRISFALVAQKDDDHESSPERGEEVAADGSQTLGPVDPGDYLIQMWVRSRGGDQWESSLVASQPITLVAGENRATVAIPALYSLTVEAPGEAGDGVQVARLDADGNSRSWTRGSLDANHHVVFEDLVAGEYLVESSGGEESGEMRVHVPISGPVPFRSKPMNALTVWLSGDEGRLAKAGFKGADVIFAVDGAEFATSEEMQRAIGAKLVNKTIVFTVDREGKKVEISVDSTILANPFDLGGQFMPARH
jgi:hypothetical protein